MKFLINTITHWEEPPRTRHFVTLSLSKKHEVAFVAANQTGWPCIRVNKVSENLTVITPCFPVSMKIRYRLPVLNEIYQHWLFRKIYRTYGDFEVINFDYTATRIFRYFKNVIYYCNDSFYEISKRINPAIIARYHRWCESLVAAGSAFCVAISNQIKKELQPYNPDVIVIPLGSPDIDEFGIQVLQNPTANKTVRVILVAVIKKLNISPNVLNLLLGDDNISLTVAGPIENGYLDQIPQKDKLIIKGFLAGRDLYEEINQADVAIAPYSVKTMNDIFSATGGKIYHYLSVGKPVVISYMPGLSELGLQDKLIYPAREEEDFPALVHRAHEENTADLIRQRIEYAKRNTWISRMEDLVAYYNAKKPEVASTG